MEGGENMYKTFRKVVVAAAVVFCLCMNAGATGPKLPPVPHDGAKMEITSLRATGSFNVSVKPYAKAKGDTDFPLEAGETVRIYATYSPDSASMDFGLIDPDGVFHYVGAENGIIDTTIEVPLRGNYRLGIKNNSGQTVDVLGFIKY